MRDFREQIPEDGLFRMLYDLMNQLGLPRDSVPPPMVSVSEWDERKPPLAVDPQIRRPFLGFDVSQGTLPQPPTIVDPRPTRPTPPPPSFNVSQGNLSQPPNIVDPRRPQHSPGMFSPETARSADLVRQAMLRGGFNRRR